MLNNVWQSLTRLKMWFHNAHASMLICAADASINTGSGASCSGIGMHRNAVATNVTQFSRKVFRRWPFLDECAMYRQLSVEAAVVGWFSGGNKGSCRGTHRPRHERRDGVERLDTGVEKLFGQIL